VLEASIYNVTSRAGDRFGLERDDPSAKFSVKTLKLPRRVVLAAGGTAGHVYPALAIADAYRQAVAPLEAMFFGTADGFEARLVPRSGMPFSVVRSSPMVGENLLGKGRTLANIGGAFLSARKLLQAAHAELVIGLGGYASVPVLMAARSLGLHTAIHECNADPGLANKLLSRIVDRVYLGFETAAAHFQQNHSLVIGNPVRPDVALLAADKRHPPAGDRPARLLVTGGSQGSAFLNRKVPELLKRLSSDGFTLDIRHQAGEQDVQAVRSSYQQAGLRATVSSFVDDIAASYQWADFAITCAGAATLSELAVAGVPSLLVPLSSAARNHQVSNAATFAAASGSCWVSESSWQPDNLASEIARLLRHQRLWLEASARLRQAAKPHAARMLVDDCEAAIAQRV